MRSLGSVLIAYAVLISTERAGAEAGATHVWYRSAVGCPDGPDFVARLAALGRNAQLASAGDPVDFVVTLGAAPADSVQSGQWMGRIERQTERGTVAIRELRARNCEDIAASLALSLDLALSPEGATASEPTTTSAAGSPQAAEPPAALPGVAGASRQSSARPPARPLRPLLPPVSEQEVRHLALRLGLHGTLLTGVAPEPMPGMALFGELGGREAPGVRLSLRGGYRTVALTKRELRIAVVAGRIEGCPWSWSRKSVSFEPCLALDLGTVRGEATGNVGRADSGIWSSVAALLRSGLELESSWSLEFEVGVGVPLVRYDFMSYVGEGRLYRTDAVALAAGLGAAWALR